MKDLSEYTEDSDSLKMVNTVIKVLKIIKRSIEKGHFDLKLGFDFKKLIYQFVYLFNFVILKNEKYKKIIVSFPGTTSYLQILDEFFYSQMKDLHIGEDKKIYYVMDGYYKIFSKIEEDLFNALGSIEGINDPEYQIIFTGHSIGGAIATVSSFYYIKKYNFAAENILITYGQPMVGSESFAKEFTNIMNNKIYRIARPNDFGTQFPFIQGIDIIIKFARILVMAVKLKEFIENIAFGNYFGAAFSAYFFIRDIRGWIEENAFLFQNKDSEDTIYSQIGGLYMIDDDTDTVYQCDDFFNEKRTHFLCKNHKPESLYTVLSEYKTNRNYLTLDQDIMSGCQERKLVFAVTMIPDSLDLNFITWERRLEEIKFDNNNNNYYFIKRNRKLDYIEDIQESLRLFEEINFQKNKIEFYFKYESTKIIENDNLIIIINPSNNYLGDICITQNKTLLINNEFENIKCYSIDLTTAIGFKIDLKKEIIDEKELYIYIKGKVSGTLELYDSTKNKTLNISNSYRIPYISNFTSEKSLNFVLPKLEENIYLNFYINNYDVTENITITSIFEIFKGSNQLKYNNNYFILEKGNEYYFKYYPGEYELLINFIPIYSNIFIEKPFYIGKEENIYINYDIESIRNNQHFGLFFDFNGFIDIKGDFSNNIKESQDTNEDYFINVKVKYINLLKSNDDYKYFSLDIKVNPEKISNLVIFDIHEVIIINKIDSIYEIKKGKNYLFLLDEKLKKNYAKVQSYSLISINNENNILKLIPINDDIVTSKNYLITSLYKIQAIFVKTKEDGIFKIKLISEEISKYLKEETGSYFDKFGNTFIDDKKYSIDFIHCNEEIYSFYDSKSNDLKLYEINDLSYFDDISNDYLNFTLFPLGENILEKDKTYMILKKSPNAFLYEKYFSDLNIILNNNILEYSKIFYLFSDFEYSFVYYEKNKKILMKVLNNKSKKTTLNFICNNKTIEIKNDIEILNVENCNESFTISGNNSLVYFYLPITVNSYNVIKDKDNFELNEIYHFFFVPKKNGFNSINILFDIEYEDYYDSADPVFLDYYIDFGIIPYTSNIEKRQIIFRSKANLVIPNYSDLSNDNETYYIYFRFNTTIAKLNAKIIYENIIYLEDQAYIVLKPGINTIKFVNNIDHYLNLTKLYKNKNSNSNYTIYKDEVVIEKNIINDTDNIIYIEEPSYRENIKLKIENEEEILLRVSPEKFDDFSFISYNKNLDIKQIEDNLRIKFNTTNFNSKLEYQIGLIEKEDNIDSILIQKKFAENNMIYKTTLYSAGNEPIETNISLANNNNITYDKNYTIIVYGKDFYGNSLNYFYMEPETLFITDPSKPQSIEPTNSITNNVKNSENPIIAPQATNTIKETNIIESKTNNLNQETNVVSNNIESNNTKPIVEPTSKTTTESSETKPNIESTTDKEPKGTINPEENTQKEIREPSNTLIEKESDKSESIHVIKPTENDSKKKTLIIVFSILGCIIVIGGVIGMAIYLKKQSLNAINNNVNNTSKNNSGIVSLKNYTAKN